MRLGSVMIDFLRFRYIAVLFSCVLISIFVGVFIYKRQTTGHAFEYSIDFTGGTQALLKFEKPVSTVEIKNILAKAGWPNVITRDFSETEVLVRVKEYTPDAKGLAERMREKIAESIPDNKIELLESETIGESVGAVLRSKSMYAIGFAIIAMLLYIALTFWSFAFGIGAIAALVHDAIMMLGICMLFSREISMTTIGAIMAILGYSVNDTIVIFAQIKKNIKKMRGESLSEVVNASLNQTLRRTLLTSFSTILAISAMFIFGGEVLRGFSLMLLIGIVFGTYSSIYIASPVMMLFYRKR